MSANNTNTSKQNSQALRDKLNQSLKQRLSRRAGEPAATQESAGAAPADQADLSIESLQDLPTSSDKSGQADRSKQFLDDIESEAQKEVEKMDYLPLFQPPAASPAPEAAQNNKDSKTAQQELSEQEQILRERQALAPRELNEQQREQQREQFAREEQDTQSKEQQSRPVPEQGRDRHEPHSAEPSDAQGPKNMTQEDEAKNEPSSLRDLLKSAKGDTKSGSFLKAPRQNTQNSQNSQQVESETEMESTSAASKKDTFLKAPRLSRQSQQEHSPPEITRLIASEAPSHEQEIIEAIRRGDSEWIKGQARLSEISEARQEIILIFSLAQPNCIEALLDLGLKFNPDPKTGLALRTAISKKHYGALDILKTKKARIDLDTLKAVAAWRRSQQLRPSSVESHEPDAMEGPVAKKLQDDFDQFLIDHATELGDDDLSAFSKPAQEAAPIPPAPIPSERIPSARIDDDVVPSTVLDDDPSLNDFGSLSLGTTESKQAPIPEPQQGDVAVEAEDSAAFDGASTEESHAAAFEADSAAERPIESEKKRPATGRLRHGRQSEIHDRHTNPHATEQDMPTTPANPSERKAPSSAAGISPMDRARLAMLDKVMAEKQQLEMRVIELQMYEEVAASLEDERNRLLEELAESQDAQDELADALEATKVQYVNFDKIKSNLEAQISKSKTDAAHAAEAAENDKDLLRQAQQDSQASLRESEKREADLRAANASLSAKISELENRKAPTPEAPDWLKGSEKEAKLRKDLFIQSIINGEHKLLDKLSKNTSTDNETAHLALIFAAEADQVRCAQWLVANMDVHPGFGGELAMRRALEGGHYDMARWLASEGADIHHAEEFALRIAVDRDDPDMVDFLVELGANPRAASERALIEAAREASWKVFRALLSHGCTGLNEHGATREELAEHEEAREQMAWVAAQRKMSKALDPDFAKRQSRR